MCLIAFAWKADPAHSLVMVANRDEFHARAATPLGWWKDAPQILAGRDLQEGFDVALEDSGLQAAQLRRLLDPAALTRGGNPGAR